MSGLLVLLDDVAALAKVAASQVDDVAALAAKAGSKSIGVVIDDAAVTPKFVEGLPAARELNVIWRIARGSLFNKLFILAPIALLIEAFAPFLLAPILLLGGLYLSFEGAEKLLHSVHILPHQDTEKSKKAAQDTGKLEDRRVRKALKTDFILSAEITAISLAAIETTSLAMKAAALLIIVSVITFGVYGVVALIIRADDVGLRLQSTAKNELIRQLGRGLVRVMPSFVKMLAIIGTGAMLWVGGSIIVHSLKDLDVPMLYKAVDMVASNASAQVSVFSGAINWAITAVLDAAIGFVAGAILVFVFLLGSGRGLDLRSGFSGL